MAIGLILEVAGAAAAAGVKCVVMGTLLGTESKQLPASSQCPVSAEPDGASWRGNMAETDAGAEDRNNLGFFKACSTTGEKVGGGNSSLPGDSRVGGCLGSLQH